MTECLACRIANLSQATGDPSVNPRPERGDYPGRYHLRVLDMTHAQR